MPVFGIALCMLASAALARVLPWHPLWLLAPALCLGLALRRAWRHPARWGLCFSLCLLWCQARGLPSAGDLSRRVPARPLRLELEIEIAGDSRERAFSGGEAEIRVPAWVRRVRYLPEWEPTYARAQLRVDVEGAPRFVPGSRWRVTARAEPGDAAFIGLRRATWILKTDAPQLEALPDQGTARIRHAFFKVRDRLSRRLETLAAADPEAGDVLQALLLSHRAEVDAAWNRRFARTGLVHVFAVSGLHLGLLAGMLLWLCRHAGLSPRWRWLVVLPFLFGFTACTGFCASALRALIMSACVFIAPLFYRRAHTGAAFASAATLILAWAPEQWLDVGFQYSFLLVGGLILAASRLDQNLSDWLRGDPWTPREQQWPWWKVRIARPLLGLFAVSLLCFLVSTPITARTFHLFSPVALLGNVLAVPLAFLALACGFPALLLLELPDPAAMWFLAPSRWTARGLLAWVEVLETIPHGVQWVRGPARWELLFCYVLPLAWWRWPKHARAWLAIALLAGGFSLTRFWQRHARAELVVLGVGEGQAAWLRNARGEVLLIDTGGRRDGWRVRDALQADGIDRIAALILTHPDRHHVGGLERILESHVPESLWVAGADRSHPAFEKLETRPLRAGDTLALAGWTVEVLHPPEDIKARGADERSLVLRVTDGNAAVILQGGADERVEAQLVSEGPELSARLILAGHPSSRPACSPDFLRAVRPEAVVFSGTAFQGVSPVRAEAEARVAQAGISLWRVPDGGNLRFDLRRGTRIPD